MNHPDAPDLAPVALPGVMAEQYRASGVPASDAIGRVHRTAEDLTRDGDPIRLLLAVRVPDDEATLWFFAPATEATTGRLVERVGLAVDRIVACTIEHPVPGEGREP